MLTTGMIFSGSLGDFFELSTPDLVIEPFTISALDHVLYIGMLINIVLIKFRSIKVDL